MTLIGARTLRGDTSTRTGGTVVNWIGDSISPLAQFFPGYGRFGRQVNLRHFDFLAWAHLLSNGRILYGKAAGISGQGANQMWPRVDPDALSMGGNLCGITTGTNDSAAGRSGALFAADLRKICSAIVARGQTPILTTGVPNPSSDRALMDTYRRFQITYAADNGWPLVDFYTVLVDPATGGYRSAYDSADGGIHPNFAGKKAMGQEVVNALTYYFQPWTSLAPTANLAASSANLLNNSQFLTDTNADGVPDGWVKTGAGTVALTTGDSGINGNALRLTDSGSSGLTTVVSTISSAVGGHRIAFTGLVKVPGTGGTILSLASGSSNTLVLTALRGLSGEGWVEPFTTWQRFYLEGLAPTGSTTATVTLSSTTIGGPGLDVSVAQLGVYDLTACGVL